MWPKNKKSINKHVATKKTRANTNIQPKKEH